MLNQTQTTPPWTLPEVIIGLPLAIVLVFCLGFITMYPVKSHSLTAAGSAPKSSAAAKTSHALPEKTLTPLPVAPHGALPALKPAASNGTNMTAPINTSTPQPATAGGSNLQAAPASSTGTGSPQAQAGLTPLFNTLQTTTQGSTKPLNTVVPPL